MKDTEPISMKNLGENKVKSKIQIIVLTVLLTSLFMMAGKYIYENVTAPEIDKAPTITLEDVIIAYAPETKSIVFLDRKTGNVELILSDSVSLTVFALKSSEIVSDYSSKVNK